MDPSTPTSPSTSRRPSPKGRHHPHHDHSTSSSPHQHQTAATTTHHHPHPHPQARSPPPLSSSTPPMTNAPPVSNVFSDEFSLEPLDGHLRSSGSPVSSVHSSINSRSSTDTDTNRMPYVSPFGDSSEVLPQDDTTATPSPPPAGPTESDAHQQQHQQHPHNTTQSETASVAPASSSASSIVESAPSVTQRSISTSSRFSMPRAMSPYRGQTGPSHPYAMYPQGIAVGRSSSSTSTSTVRPGEQHHHPQQQNRGPVAALPPQHPYAMYSQNTVPEEVPDEPQSDPSLPLGFPVAGDAYQNASRPPPGPNELGEIVGPDGHAEQLPPYSRYPDALPPKQDGDENLVVDSAVSRGADETPVSPDSGLSSRTLMPDQAPPGGGGQNENRGVEEEDDANGGFKEKITRHGQKRVCCGIPIWMFLVCAAVLVLGGVVGGVVGGLLGTQQGVRNAVSKASSSASATSSPPATVTVTAGSTLDATPLSAEVPDMSPVPTGSYKLGTSELSDNSSTCVLTDKLSHAWQCRDDGVLSYSIYGSGGSHNITLKSYDLETNFYYGAQNPIFHRKEYTLYLKQDKKHMKLGPALFFYAPFDKLIIISEDDFPYVASSRRSIGATEVKRLADDSKSNYGQVGDKPWFCWWNATYLEGFFYINQSRSPGMYDDESAAANYEPSPTVSSSSEVEDDASGYDYQRNRRKLIVPVQAEKSTSPTYPRAVRFAEKRLSQNGYPPYCEQMQVMDDGSITGPIGRKVNVTEADTQSGPTVTGQYPDINAVRRRTEEDLSSSSTCYCDWFLP